MRTVLNLGCGHNPAPKEMYPSAEWIETRVDLNPDFKPDVIADLRKLPFEDDHADSVFMCHVLEHFNYRDRYPVLREIHRVLKPKGFLYLLVPDMCSKPVLKALSDGDVTRIMYVAPAGPITAEQVIFGQFYAGDLEVHKSGYSHVTLREFLSSCFERLDVSSNNEFSLQAIAWK